MVGVVVGICFLILWLVFVDGLVGCCSWLLCLLLLLVLRVAVCWL